MNARLKTRSASAMMISVLTLPGGGKRGELPYPPYCWGKYDPACCELDADGGVSAKRHRSELPGMICINAPLSTCRTSTNVGSKAST